MALLRRHVWVSQDCIMARSACEVTDQGDACVTRTLGVILSDRCRFRIHHPVRKLSSRGGCLRLAAWPCHQLHSSTQMRTQNQYQLELSERHSSKQRCNGFQRPTH